MKTCSKCKTEKALTEFYKNRSRADGLDYYCKPCRIASVNKYQATDAGKAVHCKSKAKYRATDAGKKYHSKYNVKWRGTDVGKKALKKAQDKQRKMYPEKIKSRNAVNNAIRGGRLIKSDTCSKCGATECRIEGHHPDYDKPLEVIWLCTPCHVAIHQLEEVA